MAHIAIAACADAAVIAALHHATITLAYRGYFPHSPPPTVAELQAIWTTRLADPTAVALLASRDGRPAGSVMARADPQFNEGQIVGLHVLPSQWSQGIGSALHDSAVAELSKAGYRTAGLWVIAANQRARLYEKRGWVLRPQVEQNDYGVIEVRYRRDLLVPVRDSSQSGPRNTNTTRDLISYRGGSLHRQEVAGLAPSRRSRPRPSPRRRGRGTKASHAS